MGEFLLCFLGNIMFDNGDSFQAYLIFNQYIYIYIYIYIKIIANKLISEWKSKGLSNESIKRFPTSDNSL